MKKRDHSEDIRELTSEKNPSGAHSSPKSSKSTKGESDPEDDEEGTEADIEATDEAIEDSGEKPDDTEYQEPTEVQGEPIEICPVNYPSLSVNTDAVSVTDSIELAESNKENPLSVGVTEISVNTTTDEIQDVIEPTSNDSAVSKVMTTTVSTSRSSHSVANQCKPTGRSAMRTRAPSSLQVNQRTVRLEQQNQTAAQTDGAVSKLNEILEFEKWEADSAETSTPLSRRRPQVVIHKQPEGEPDSFEYLCRVLRDYYTLMKGGEPTISAVEFVSNRPRIPSLSNKIIRLDMTQDKWELEAGADRVYARREGTDILSKLATLSRTQFAGSLGFLVINIPAQAGQSLFATDGISTRIYDYLTDAIESGNNQNTTVVHTSPSNNRANWGTVMSEYLGFEIDADGHTVREVEDQYLQRIEQPDWHAIALTERQGDETDQESDRHYLYKSAIANSIGRIAYQDPDNQDYDTYRKFLSEVVSDHVLTEEEEEVSGSESDILIKWDEWNGYTASLLETFIDADDIEWDTVGQMAIEFETGRAEGAFEFRKIHETIEKYDQTDVDLIAIVTSPWIVEIDRMRRGQHSQIEKLVGHKNRFSDEQEFRIYRPKFDAGGCVGLENITEEAYNE